MPLTQESVSGRAALRALKQPIYDTGVVPAGALNRITYFQAPQGVPIVPAGLNKSEADTNMKQSGAIGRPAEFEVYGFNLEIWSTNYDDNVNTCADMQLIYDTGVFEFYFGQQRPWLQIPVMEIPNGSGIEGTVGCGTVGNDYFFAHNGQGWASGPKSYYDFAIGKQPIPIASNESFSARLEFPSGAITATNVYRARCFMRGILYAAL